jgi:hypothetical protein
MPDDTSGMMNSGTGITMSYKNFDFIKYPESRIEHPGSNHYFYLEIQ